MFILSSDTCVDLPKHILKENNVNFITMKFIRDGVEFSDDFDSDEDYVDFYEKIDAGALVKTSQCGLYEYEEYFRKLLRENVGDVVHLNLSSGISGSFTNSVAASETVLAELEFNGRAIYCIDSKSGAAGQCLLLDVALSMREADCTAEQTAAELDRLVPNIQHWVYIDDLTCLRRGGRISAVSAVIGSVLHIKPVAIVNGQGKIRLEKKLIGYKKAISFISDKIKEMSYPETIINGKAEPLTVYICHANCKSKLADLIESIKEKIKCKIKTMFCGPLIGAHVGPGAMGIFFLGKPRLVN